MSDELKSTIDLVMERFKASEEASSLTEGQKREIAEIRKRYEAKIAEAEILLAGKEELSEEVARLRREMEEKVAAVRKSSRDPNAG
jgi:hypothetical protein